jgi:hypothetical protein
MKILLIIAIALFTTTAEARKKGRIEKCSSYTFKTGTTKTTCRIR